MKVKVWKLLGIIFIMIFALSAFTSVPTRATAVNGSQVDPGTILGMIGTVEISVNGSNEWRPLVPSDTISPGDMIMTGSDGILLVKFSSGKILLGEETNLNYVDPHHLRLLLLVLGSMWAELENLAGGSDEDEVDVGVNVVVGVRGT